MARLHDGFSTTIALAVNPTFVFFEKEVTPPGVVGGGPINVDSMRNLAWHTQMHGSLLRLKETGAKVSYDPIIYAQVPGAVNVNTTVLVAFPDAATLAFFGFLDEWNPDTLKEHEEPTAGIKIEPTLLDLFGTESAPLFTPGTLGTIGAFVMP
jgi:hypothetical protein